MTKAERERVKKGLGGASNFIDAVERGEMELEDLPPETLRRLQQMLARAEKK